LKILYILILIDNSQSNLNFIFVLYLQIEDAAIQLYYFEVNNNNKKVS